MAKRVLLIATVDQHIRHFHLPLINELYNQGYKIDIASNGDEKFENIENKYSIPFQRNPFSKKNYDAFKKLEFILNQNHYNYIHVNTPVGSVIGRLAARKFRKTGTKVIYTAHGFHFFKGAPIKNWLIYFPLELLLSHFTDNLLVMNSEDYKRAKKFYRTPNIKYIDGVGVDNTKFSPPTEKEKENLRESLGYDTKDTIVLYVAEVSKRKNQKFIIDTLILHTNNLNNIKFIFIGKGELLDELKDYVFKNGLETKIDFLGYRNDVSSFMKIADIVVSSSLQEGLPVNIIEAQMTEIPCIVSDSRGNRDLVVDGINGIVFSLDDDGKNRLYQGILELHKDKIKRTKFGQANKFLTEKYSIDTVIKEIIDIYS